MKKRIQHGRSGETLVEVMVCAVLFLMMVAVMQGAISFAANALQKSAQIRENHAAICRSLRESGEAVTGIDKKSCTFRATSVDGSGTGNEVFTVDVVLGKKTVSYPDGQGGSHTVDFYLYGPVDEEAGGGGP